MGHDPNHMKPADIVVAHAWFCFGVLNDNYWICMTVVLVTALDYWMKKQCRERSESNGPSSGL